MRPLDALVGSLMVLGAMSCERPSRAEPNVILISIDCLNQRQLESALAGGYAPALEALTAESISFSRAYAHAPWTTPSHMSMMSGLYPSQHGRDVPYGLMIQWNDYHSRVPNFETVADRLAEAGYDTAAFVGQGSISASYGIARGFDVFSEHRKAFGEWTDLPAVFADLEPWLEKRAENPFFLFVHTYDLHGPRPKGLEAEADAIRYIDQFLSRIVTRLESEGLYESSLVILTGDHGSEMIETDEKCCVHGAGHYEENIHVPLLVKLPGQAPAREEARLARHVDLFPTIMEVAGVDTDYDGPGRSLLAELADEEVAVSFSEADGRCALRRAIVSERYKYIYTPSGVDQALLQQNERFFDDTCPEVCRELPAEELYDLIKDPFEKQNLLEGRLNEERAEWLDRMRLEMATHLNLPVRYTESVVTGPREGLDDEKTEELLESLRTLGYIQ